MNVKLFTCVDVKWYFIRHFIHGTIKFLLTPHSCDIELYYGDEYTKFMNELLGWVFQKYFTGLISRAIG